jgi:hypothetical protein
MVPLPNARVSLDPGRPSLALSRASADLSAGNGLEGFRDGGPLGINHKRTRGFSPPLLFHVRYIESGTGSDAAFSPTHEAKRPQM